MKDANGHEHEPAGTPIGGARGSAVDASESVFTAEEKQALKDYFRNHEAINAALINAALIPSKP